MAATDIWTPPNLSDIPHHHSAPCDCEETLAYLRVSKVGLRQMIVSPDIQLDGILMNCRLKNKRVVAIVADIDKSGRCFSKRSVDNVIRAIKRGEAKSVTIYKWSRWGRNVMKSLVYLQKTKEAGGRVDSATEDIDQSTAVGRFSRDMIMRVDQLLSEQIGEGWQAAHDQRRGNGLPHTGRRRFGYEYVPATPASAAQFVVSETEGPALRQCYMRYVAGESLRVLARWLNQHGLRTPMGNRWTPEALGQALDTGFGAGWIRERKGELLERSREKSLSNNLTTFNSWRPGAHEAVIDEATWEAYKRRRRDQAGLPPRARTPSYALSTLVFCELCANRMGVKKTGPKRQKHWVCMRGSMYHPEASVSISNDRALDVVRRWLGRQVSEPPAGLDAEARAEIEARAVKSGRTRDKIRAEKDNELRVIERLVALLAREKISEDEFDQVKAEAMRHITELDAEYASVPVASDNHRPDYAAFVSMEDAWGEAIAEGREVLLNAPLRELVAYVVVSPAAGRGRWHDASDRVEVVGCWEADSKRRWLEARRKRFSA
jgi:site-specific DNA recombinase